MSKISLIIGVAVSIIIHAVLFIGVPRNSAAVAINETKQQQTAKIELPIPKDVQQVKDSITEPHTLPELPEKIVKAKTDRVHEGYGDFAEEIDEDLLPTLRLVWDSPSHLIRASKILGLKVLPVNSDDTPLGELIFERDIIVGRFQGGLSRYSNRVRTIDAQFFGSKILNQCPDKVRHFWIVVPASVDQKWILAQKQALIKQSLKCSEVSYMEAKLVSNGSSFELVITKIVTV